MLFLLLLLVVGVVVKVAVVVLVFFMFGISVTLNYYYYHYPELYDVGYGFVEQALTATLKEPINKYCVTTVETCAYTGTGDVLKVQGMLALCGEHIAVDEASAWKV